MNKTMKMTVLAMMALLAGCAAETGDEDGSGGDDANEAIGTTNEALSVSSTYRVPLDWHGGTGGTARTVSCGSGDVVIGFYGSYGNYINELGLYCARLRSDGTLGPAYATSTVGARGPYSFSSRCIDGYMMTGLWGRSATYLDELGGYCTNPKGPTSDAADQAPAFGGYGGTRFNDDCWSGYALTSFTVRSGSWVDAVRGTCSYLNP